MTLAHVEVYEPRIMTTATHRFVPIPVEIHSGLPAVFRHHHILADIHLVATDVKPDLQPIRPTDFPSEFFSRHSSYRVWSRRAKLKALSLGG